MAVAREIKRDVRIIVACMPKSGSTFLAAMIANLPGMRRVSLVPGHMRREQEICLKRLEEENAKTRLITELYRRKELVVPIRPRGFVAQMHLRYSEPTAEILENYNITPVVLVRNIFDIVMSVRDHFYSTGPHMAMAYCSEAMRKWPEEKMHHFIADMVIPWYINFFMCWRDCPNKLLVTYEGLTSNNENTLRDVAAFAGIRVSKKAIADAIANTDQAKTRKNKATVGRGQELAQSVKDKILHLASHYPNVDFSPIGLPRPSVWPAVAASIGKLLSAGRRMKSANSN